MSTRENQDEICLQTSFLMSGTTISDYFTLLKPRVMSLVVFTAFAGLMLAPGEISHWTSIMALLCIAVGAGAAGALNMWYDADIDSIMERTASRPIPAGKISPKGALRLGLVLSGGAIVALGLIVNWFSATLLAFTIFFYVVVYTMWLKRSTPQNIVIGGAAGALPPMVGWACVTGDVSWNSAILFLIIFLWTPAHFWSLALCKMDEYKAAGIPMLPNVAGIQTTKRSILVYTLLTAFVPVVPTLTGLSSFVYGLIAFSLGIVFIYYAIRVYIMTDVNKIAPKKMFSCSIFYLFFIFLALMMDHLI